MRRTKAANSSLRTTPITASRHQSASLSLLPRLLLQLPVAVWRLARHCFHPGFIGTPSSSLTSSHAPHRRYIYYVVVSARKSNEISPVLIGLWLGPVTVHCCHNQSVSLSVVCDRDKIYPLFHNRLIYLQSIFTRAVANWFKFCFPCSDILINLCNCNLHHGLS